MMNDAYYNTIKTGSNKIKCESNVHSLIGTIGEKSVKISSLVKRS